MRALFLVVPLLVAGCDIQTKSPAGSEERVAMKGDASGNLQFDLPIAKGNIKLPAGMMAKSDFDLDGVKLMPGGKITGFNVDAGNGPTVVDMAFSAPMPPADARAYFLQQFQAKGVEAVAAGDSVTGTSKDGTAFVIRFAPGAQGTNGTIELHPKE